MLAILYLATGWYIGDQLVKRFFPQLYQVEKQDSFYGSKIPLKHWMVTYPASFLIGVLTLTWVTYFCAYFFKARPNPLFYGNICSLTLFTTTALFFIITKQKEYLRALKKINLSQVKKFFQKYRLETILIITILIVACFMMFYTFHIKDGRIYVGLSVFSDFGPHLAVIRSFSYGSNFPTEYPHFANGQARYHFLFQFLSGNLEFLGLPLDWAFNLPSILAFVSFLMLLYALTVIIMGRRWVGILTVILFFFRSSMAFFRYLNELISKQQTILTSILQNETFIGKTLHEDWGLWAQNVYVNQRHFAFSLGIMLIVIIMSLPLFTKMLKALKLMGESNNSRSAWLNEFFLKADAWLPHQWGRAIAIGLLLGLTGFWNGAVVIGTLLILMILAVFSKHRLEFLTIALITVFVTLLQTSFFVGPGGSVIQPRLEIGFLAYQKDWSGIWSFYKELLGVLPLALIAGLCFAPRGSFMLALAFLAPLVFATTVQLTPDIAMNHKFVIISVFLLNMIAANFLYYLFTADWTPLRKWKRKPKKSVSVEGLENADEPPQPALVEQAAGEFSEQSPVKNDKNFLESLQQMFISKLSILWSQKLTKVTVRALMRYLALILLFSLTITGIVDFITLINKNIPQRAIVVEKNDPVLQWVRNNTQPNDLFLTDAYCIHPILLAGRKIFYGWPYFTWSAGYDTNARKYVVGSIYGGYEPDQVKELLRQNKIRYIVIEDGNRTSQEYRLNETLFRENFQLVYENQQRRISIYKSY